MQTSTLVSRCSGQIQILAGTLEEFAQFTHLDVCHLIEHATKSITQSHITSHTAAESKKERESPVNLSRVQLYRNANPDLRNLEGHTSQMCDQIQTVTVPLPTQVHSAYSASDYDLPLTARMSVPTPNSDDPFGDEYEVETSSTESLSPMFTNFYSQICSRKGFPFSRSKRMIGLLCSHLEPIDCDLPRRAVPLARPVPIKPRKDLLLPDDQLDLQKELDELFRRINNLPSTVESAVSEAPQTRVSPDKIYSAGPICASPLHVAGPSPVSGSSQPYELTSPVSPLDSLFM